MQSVSSWHAIYHLVTLFGSCSFQPFPFSQMLARFLRKGAALNTLLKIWKETTNLKKVIANIES